jgi:hypothetical protein
MAVISKGVRQFRLEGYLNKSCWYQKNGQRLKWVFGIEIECCGHCGGTNKIIASLEDRQVIARRWDYRPGRSVPNAARPLPHTAL